MIEEFVRAPGLPFQRGYLFFLIVANLLPAPLSAEDPSILQQRDQLKTSWQAELGNGKLAAALNLAEQIASLERKLVDQLEPDAVQQKIERRQALIATLEWLVQASSNDREASRAIELRQEIIRNQDAIRQQIAEQQLSQLIPEQRASLANAQQYYEKGCAQFNAKKLDEALAAFARCTELRTELLGDDHVLTRAARAWMPYLYKEKGNYGDAKTWAEREMTINQEHLGIHPISAENLHDLAVFCKELSEFDNARDFFEQSLKIFILLEGPEHKDTAIEHDHLGVVLMWMGEYAHAKQHLEQSRKIIADLHLGELASAKNLQNLALLHTMLGDPVTAQPLYIQALEFASQAFESASRDVNTRSQTILDIAITKAQILDNIGLMHKALDNFEEAENHFKGALEAYVNLAPEQLREIVQNEEFPSDESDEKFNQALLAAKSTHYGILRSIARTLNNYAGLRAAKSDFEIAERIYQRSLGISRALDGSQHPATAACLDNLGHCLEDMGKLPEADDLYQQALAIRLQVLGENHIETAVSFNNLALLAMRNGDQPQARDLLHRCLRIRRRLLDETASVQNERQQLLMNNSLRGTLDDWLSVVQDESAYEEVLRWKGSIFARQAVLRLLRRRPELEPVVADLRKICGQFASLSLQVPGDIAEHLKKVEGFRSERERLETLLTVQCAEYHADRERESLTPAELQAVLSNKGKPILVDFLEYQRLTAPISQERSPSRERSFVAFVISPDGPIKRFELGSAEEIERLVDDYRVMLQDPLRSNAPMTATARELRQRIWQPFAEQLNDSQVVLVSPDGSLGNLPFAALPGKEPESYLLENYAVAVIPVPQALSSLLDYSAVPKLANRLLVVGNVQYDRIGAEQEIPTIDDPDPFGLSRGGGPQTSAALQLRGGSRSRLDRWLPLSATRQEMQNIESTYEILLKGSSKGLSTLQDSSATEDAFREQAPRHHFIHLATHGFFAPELFRSSLENRSVDTRTGSGESSMDFIGYNPGLLSGIVLAGANDPDPDGNDGLLTALEISELDLAGVYLAVLSACNTGLGSVAGGEGLLGLQRSFQVAGARCVVASMWEVPDSPTSSLMSAFYENLWIKRMNRFEALRTAQLEILNSGSRGRIIAQDGGKIGPDFRTPPNQWAAFVLSGDWH